MTYVYKCVQCGFEFEVERSIKEASHLFLCPVCNSEETTQIVVQNQGFILVGDGWAKDGYSTKNDK